MTFKDLGLSEPLLKAISKKGYKVPSPIQEKAIPLILEGKDVLASAQTGTGKTAGFTLPILQLLGSAPKLRNRPPRALIVTPTRELAAQVLEEIRSYSKFSDLRSEVVFGGVNAGPQIHALRNGVDILVATPGRLLDLHQQKAFTLAKVEILVLDEADRMLDMGFRRDIQQIQRLVPNKRQNLLFSATFSKEIKKLAESILHNPVSVEATPENTTVEKIQQTFYLVNKRRKAELTVKLISEGNWSQVLMFTRTKHGANHLSQKLANSGITSAAIHGNKSQNARTAALDGFKKGKIRVLVATDIASRGLDIPLLPHVINYELPNSPEDYVHRIGRTGRAGASGEAISLVAPDEIDLKSAIEKLVGETFESKVVEDFEPTNIPKTEEKKPANPTSFQKRKPQGRNKGFHRRPKNKQGGDKR